MKKIFGLAVIIGLALMFLTPLVARAERTGIQISPLTFNLEINPGETTSGKINIINLNNEVLNYVTEIENFTAISEEGSPSFAAGGNPQEGVTTLRDWISVVSNKEGAINPKESREISFNVSVPQGAEPGGHYAAIFAKEIKKTPEGQTQLGVASRVGALILVAAPGEVTRAAKIVDFSSPKFVWKGPVGLSLRLQNIGTVHYDAPAEVKFKSLIGESKADLGKHTLIPQSTRLYEGSWAKKYPFGYYKLTAIALDGDNQPVTAAATLWAIPIIIVIPIIIGLLILIFVLRYFKKHLRFVGNAKNEPPKNPPGNTPEK